MKKERVNKTSVPAFAKHLYKTTLNEVKYLNAMKTSKEIFHEYLGLNLTHNLYSYDRNMLGLDVRSDIRRVVS